MVKGVTRNHALLKQNYNEAFAIKLPATLIRFYLYK
jgi:hypothetical protein